MEVRGFGEGDLEALARITATAFGGSVAEGREEFDPEKNTRLDPDGVYVVEEDGEVRASATVLPMEVFVDGAPAPMGGVAAVMAHPAYRRRGYAGALMRALLGGMRERGVHLSLLSPFAHAFYRSFGYELATEAVEYRLRPADLSTSPEQRELRAYRDDDLTRMMALLEEEAKRHPVCVRRDEKRWRSYLKEGKDAAIYEAAGQIEGYIIYQMSDWKDGREPPRELKVLEHVATTPRAGEALISFLAGLDPLAFEVKYWTPRGEPLHPYLRSSYVTARVEPDQMLRLVDVEGALGHLSREIGAPLVLEVSDDVIPENAGEYTVGDGEPVRGAGAEDRARLDVRQLAQLYAGYLPARQLVRHGLVEASSEEALEKLEAYFPAGDPWVFGPDHF